MGFTLVIVESPAKTKSFEKILGSEYKCLASFGHIRSLSSLKDVAIEKDYQPTFTNDKAKYKQIAKLRDMAKKASSVLLATDDDREGEAIAWHLCQVLDLPVSTTPRLIFNEITKNAILEAVRSPSVIDMNKVHAQQARQILDLLVGFRVSPLLWKQFGHSGKSALSAGRCQTPALRLVYENQKEIESSPPQIVYTTTGYFHKGSLPYTLEHQFESENEMVSFLEESVNHEHIFKVDKYYSDSKRQPPKPFTTSAMQQAASNELRISPKEAMGICQKLYEAGLITYMRTDSRTYSNSFIGTARATIISKYGEEYVHANIFALGQRSDGTNTKKSSAKNGNKSKSKPNSNVKAQEAHEAIRPTNIQLENISREKFSSRECKLYHLVWRNTLESCMAPCVSQGCVSLISAPKTLSYRLNEEEVIFAGWRIVAGYEKTNKAFRFLKMEYDYATTNDKTNKRANKVVNYNKISAKLSTKGNKSHYTEAKLVQLLEEKGIGRPSTFSSLIDKIQTRGYVKKEDVEGKVFNGKEYELIDSELVEHEVERTFGNEKARLVLQPIGKLVWEFLQGACLPLFEYEFTKQMETDLDEIAEGERVWHTLCKECDENVHALIEDIGDNVKKSNSNEIQIDADHVYKVTQYGPALVSVVDGKKVYQTARKDLDIDKLRNGEYAIDDIIDKANPREGKCLGNYDGLPLMLKKGKFGYYVTWGENKKSVASLGKRESNITYKRVVELIEEISEVVNIRRLNNDVSIRTGKFGVYIFHKTPKMKKPSFYSLKTFDEDPFHCNHDVLAAWIETKYKLTIG